MAIKCIKVYITPFHQRAISNVLPNKYSDEETLIFYSEFVKLNVLSGLTYFIKPAFSFKRKMLLNPFVINDLQIEIHGFLKQVLSEHELDDTLEIMIGTDRDLFNQILLHFFKGNFKKSKVYAIDEGTGFYASRKLYDYLYIYVYKFYSFVFLKYPLSFVKPMGCGPLIDIVYLRYPDKVKFRNSKILYKTFNLTDDSKIANNLSPVEGDIIIFSTPNDFISSDKKADILREIIKFYVDLNKIIVIKPHPREDVKSLEFLCCKNVRILNRNIASEDLEFSNFEKVIHFESSVVLELFERGIDRKKVITLVRSITAVNDLFHGTKILNLKKMTKNSFADNL